MENSKIGKFWAIGKEIIFWEWKHWFGELKYLYIFWTDFYCFIHFTVFYHKSILQFSLNCLVKNYRQNTWWLADIEWKAWKVVYLYDLVNLYGSDLLHVLWRYVHFIFFKISCIAVEILLLYSTLTVSTEFIL
jgi:hypothetical protein